MARPSLFHPALSALALSALLCGPVWAGDSKDSKASLTQGIETNLKDAQAKRQAGDFPGAVKILSQLMLINPDDGRVVSEYGKVLVQQGRAKEAIDFLKRAVQLSSTDWTLYSALGVAFDANNDYANAKLAYEQALHLKPEEPAVLNNYALSRALAGDLPAAKTLIGEAAAKSQDPRVARNVAMINGLSLQAPAAPAIKTETKPSKTAAASLNKPTPGTATTTPRPLSPTEGQKVVMQAVPSDPLAGPVKKPRKTASAAPAEKPEGKTEPKKSKDGVPALRLGNDRL